MKRQHQKTTSLTNLTFADCLKFMKSHWYLFVISIFICSTIACLLIVSTPRVYQRSVRIMFSENNSQSIGIINGVDFHNETVNVPLKKNVNNEKELFKSTYLMLEVVKLLELDIVYERENKQKSEENDMSSPLKVHFLEPTQGSFRMKALSETEVELSDFSITQDERSADVIRANVSDTIESPVGKIAISHTPYFSEKSIGGAIIVRRSDPLSLASYYAGKLNVDIIKNSTSLKLSISDRDIKKADAILMALVKVYDKEYINDKRQVYASTLDFIDQYLANADKETGKDLAFEKKTSNRVGKKNDFSANTNKNRQQESYSQYLLQKKAEITLASVNISSNCMMIDAPAGSSTPVKPQKKIIFLVAIFVAVFIPYFYFFFRLFLNTKIINISEIRKIIPFVGLIPLYKKKNKRQKDTVDDIMVVEKDNYSVVGEAFRMLRNNIDIDLCKNDTCPIITFTSFEKGSGKSFTSFNTAISFALTGKKVLFADFDLHDKSISNLFNASTSGITDYLLHDDTVSSQDIILKNNVCPDMDFILAGKTLANPSDIVTRGKLEKLFSDLTQTYDYIFIDTASLNRFAEVSVVGELSDMMLLVIGENVTDRRVLQEIEAIQQDNRYKKITFLYNRMSKDGIRGFILPK